MWKFLLFYNITYNLAKLFLEDSEMFDKICCDCQSQLNGVFIRSFYYPLPSVHATPPLIPQGGNHWTDQEIA